jgi:hypothetical protein
MTRERGIMGIFLPKYAFFKHFGNLEGQNLRIGIW